MLYRQKRKEYMLVKCVHGSRDWTKETVWMVDSSSWKHWYLSLLLCIFLQIGIKTCLQDFYILLILRNNVPSICAQYPLTLFAPPTYPSLHMALFPLYSSLLCTQLATSYTAQEMEISFLTMIEPTACHCHLEHIERLTWNMQVCGKITPYSKLISRSTK